SPTTARPGTAVATSRRELSVHREPRTPPARPTTSAARGRYAAQGLPTGMSGRAGECRDPRPMGGAPLHSSGLGLRLGAVQREQLGRATFTKYLKASSWAGELTTH